MIGVPGSYDSILNLTFVAPCLYSDGNNKEEANCLTGGKGSRELKEKTLPSHLMANQNS